MSELMGAFADGSAADAINQFHIPEIFLAIVGVLAITIAYFYMKDKDSASYKALVAVGAIAGIIMVLMCLSSSLKGYLPTMIIVLVASFALISRPFRDAPFAIIIALLFGAIVYMSLGNLTGNLDFLASGWPRVVIAIVVALIVFVLLHFVESIFQLFAKLFNWWPVLSVLGILCIVEAICVGLGYGSIIDMIMGRLRDTETIFAAFL